MSFKLFPLLCLLFCLSACTHYYYVPNAHNAPLLKEAKQLNLVAAGSIGEESGSTELQGAYAANDKIGLMVNYMSASSSFGEKSGAGKIVEAGVGYYKPLRNIFVAEVFAGSGFSSQNQNYLENHIKSVSRQSFVRSFVQADFGITHKIIELAVSGRISHLGFTKISSNLPPGSREYMRLQTVRQGSFLLAEPAITLRLGFKYVKLFLQYGGSHCINGEPAFEKFHLTGGFSVCFAKRYKRANKMELKGPVHSDHPTEL